MTSNHWKRLYNERPEDYNRMTEYEDYAGNILQTLNQIHSLEGVRIIEFGAGTGRITTQLLPLVGHIWAFDISPAMLKIAQRKLGRTGKTNWSVGMGDSRVMPVPSDWAEVAIEAWSLVQIAAWHRERWREEVGKAVDEMMRVVRPGGVVIVIETLGNGKMTPISVGKHKAVHDYLEKERGFSSIWIRTDFLFSTRSEAEKVVRPVFGEVMLDVVMETEKGLILPECTGIWWRMV